MKAVNLIPAEERRGAGGGGLSGLTLGVIAALVLALVAVFGYVSVSNGIAERQDDLAVVEANAAAAEREAAALRPYGDVAQLRRRSLEAVSTLAATRFDWSALLDELARRLPADVTLATLDGTVPDPAGAAPGSPADSTAVPTVVLKGCTADHTAVARTMERLKAVPGVTDVVFASSDRTGGRQSAASGDCPRRDQFDLTLLLAGGAAAPPPAAPVSTPTAAEGTP